MRIDSLPEHVVILGSGYIGTEFAHVFSGLGAEVSIIGRSSLLRTQDETVCERFSAIAGARWDVHLGHEVVRAFGAHGRRGAGARRRHRRARRPAARRHRARPERRPARRPPHRRADAPGRPDRGRRRAAHSRRRHLRPRRRQFPVPAQARGQPRGEGRRTQPPAPGRAPPQRPPVRAGRGLHRPADRLRRAHRGRVPRATPRLHRRRPGLRRCRLRLGDGGRDRVLQGDRRARHAAGSSAPTSWARRRRR